MHIGVLYENPTENTKEIFEHIYQAIPPVKYRNLGQTGIYGKFNTEEKAIEFTLYKGNDNKICIIFLSEGEIEIFCIESNDEDYLNNYTHFLIIKRNKDYSATLETKIEATTSEEKYIFTFERIIKPQRKVTIKLLKQTNKIECIVIKEDNAKVIRTKSWKNLEELYSETTKSNQNDLDKYIEKAKKLPREFKDQIIEKKQIIEEILKKYNEVSRRESIEMFTNHNPQTNDSPRPPIKKYKAI